MTSDPKKERLLKHLINLGVDASVEVGHEGYDVKVGHGQHLLVPSTFEGSSVRVNVQIPLGRRRRKR
jgi:hypothetical protein